MLLLLILELEPVSDTQPGSYGQVGYQSPCVWFPCLVAGHGSRELTAKKLRMVVRLTTEIVPTEVKLGTGVALQVVPWDLVFSGCH